MEGSKSQSTYCISMSEVFISHRYLPNVRAFFTEQSRKMIAQILFSLHSKQSSYFLPGRIQKNESGNSANVVLQGTFVRFGIFYVVQLDSNILTFAGLCNLFDSRCNRAASRAVR